MPAEARSRLTYVVALAVGAGLTLVGAWVQAQLAGGGSLYSVAYRGYLESGSGALEGTVDLSFRLYDTPSGGLELQPEVSLNDVQIDHGHFNVELDISPAVLARGDAWVEVTVGGSTALAPRQRLLSVPFSANGAPVGTVVPFAGAAAPLGWLFTDGSTLSAADYPALASVLGSRYGGDGTSTFALPDLRGRTVVALDNLGGTEAGLISAGWASTLGGVAGSETHTLTIAEMPSHRHELEQRASAYTDGCCNREVGYAANEASGHFTLPTGGGQPHAIVQPSIALAYIIKF